MSRKRLTTIASFAIVLALVGTACGGGGTKESTSGGIFRIGTDAFQWNSTLDPTAEYLGFAFEFFNAMHRPLLGYNHKSGANGGNTVIPDASVDMGQISSDGLTYTFKIKKGIKFAPPVSRAVTSKDFVTAFTRLANKTLSAGGYPTYYTGTIAGFKEVEDKKATTISGITTPADDTIVFKLLKPTGDFRFRLTLAATAPQPEEVAKCATKNGEYGRFQIATGPYMLDGTDKLKVTDCATMLKTPISGFDPVNFLRLRRNPNYAASTDTKESRENLIDGIDLTLNTNTDDIFKKIEEGTLDGESAQPPASVLAKATTTLKNNFKTDPGDRTWYIFFNLAKAPFDDIHVRKAVSFIIDKAALVRARGGVLGGIVAEHIVPPDVLGGKLKAGEFDPFATKGHNGDLAKALAEMKLSKYKHSSDGTCTDSACKNVLHNSRTTPPYTELTPIIEANLKRIGISLVSRPLQKYYASIQVPAQTPPIGSGGGWGKDYSDAGTFFVPLLSNEAISKDATQNFAYLGMDAAKAKLIGYKIPAAGIPSADPGIKRCDAMLGEPRAQCWADLDKTVSEDMVPWVPYLWANNFSVISNAVTKYEYDQFAGEVSFVHIAIDPSKQKKS